MTRWIESELAVAGKDPEEMQDMPETPRPGDVGSMLTTPLHVAVVKGERDTCELLLEFKADVNAPDGRNRTPLVVVLQQVLDPSLRPKPRLSGFAKGPHGNKLGRPAAAEGGVETKMQSVMEALVFAKGLPHTPGAPTTPLHDAAQRADIPWVRLLLGFGAQVNIHDWRQKTPLDLAMDEKQLRPQVPGPKPKDDEALDFAGALDETCRILQIALDGSRDDDGGSVQNRGAASELEPSIIMDDLTQLGTEADSSNAALDATLFPVEEER
jgi:hypothetical protein